MAIAVIEAARKSTCEIGASVLTTEFHLCQRDCLLQHVIPEADLASLADAPSKRSLFGVRCSVRSRRQSHNDWNRKSKKTESSPQLLIHTLENHSLAEDYHRPLPVKSPSVSAFH